MFAVFKTNVTSKSKIRKIESKMNQLFSKAKWNFDLEDCDKILRIEGEFTITETQERLLELGIQCQEIQ